MAEDKKDILLLDIRKNLEEINEQIKKIKYEMTRIKTFFLILISSILIVSISFLGLGTYFKHNIEDKLKMINTEYNKIKLLENRFKKFMF